MWTLQSEDTTTPCMTVYNHGTQITVVYSQHKQIYVTVPVAAPLWSKLSREGFIVIFWKMPEIFLFFFCHLF